MIEPRLKSELHINRWAATSRAANVVIGIRGWVACPADDPKKQRCVERFTLAPSSFLEPMTPISPINWEYDYYREDWITWCIRPMRKNKARFDFETTQRDLLIEIGKQGHADQFPGLNSLWPRFKILYERCVDDTAEMRYFRLYKRLPQRTQEARAERWEA